MRDRHHNGVKTAVLLGLLSAIILAIGSIWGSQGLVIALIIALAMNGFAYFYSDKIALRSMRAYPVTQAEQPRLYAIVYELAGRARMPMPRLYMSPTNQPNAFATGRNPQNAAVCCTEGIMRMMDDRELRGVLGHELSHVYNRDILISSVAAALASVIMFLAAIARWAAIFGLGRGDDDGPNIFEFLLLIIFGPLAAGMIQLAISRSREYQADKSGSELTSRPAGTGERAAQTRRGHPRHAAAADPATGLDVRADDCQPLQRRRDRPAVLHASADPRPDRPARGDGRLPRLARARGPGDPPVRPATAIRYP